jgi:ABC-type multidrug transport system fused ATPase/permease subunit
VLKKVFSIYWNAPGGRPIMVASLMLLASLSDLFSMGGLVPLITQITSDGGQNQSPIAQYVLGAFSRLGIEPSFLNLLAFVGTGLILKSVISMASLSYVGISVADVTTKIRTKLLDAMMHAKWSYFVDHKAKLPRRFQRNPPWRVRPTKQQQAMSSPLFQRLACLWRPFCCRANWPFFQLSQQHFW